MIGVKYHLIGFDNNLFCEETVYLQSVIGRDYDY